MIFKTLGFGNLQILMTVALYRGFPPACVLVVFCAALRQTAAASTEPSPWKQPSCGLERRSLARRLLQRGENWLPAMV